MAPHLSILLLEGLSDAIGLIVARCLADAPGIKVHVLAADADSHLRYSRYCASFHLMDVPLEDPRAIDRLQEVITATRADVVMPVMEAAVRFTAANKARISAMTALVPTPDLTSFDLVCHKGELARFLDARGLPGPPTVIYTPDAGFYERVSRLCFPVMLKPATARGGRDIRRFESLADLRAFCEANGPLAEPYIVQSYIRGYDIDCSVLCQDGRVLAYTQQKAVIAPATTYGPSQGIAILHHEGLLEATERFIAALGWSGIAHIDLRYSADDDEIKVIELNPRYWFTMLGSQIAGVNFPRLAVMAALGRPFERPAYADRNYAPFTTAITEGLRGLRGQEHVSFRYGDTNARYLLADPLPTLMRGFVALARKLPVHRAAAQGLPVGR
jgi:predicted ATP-grasp superfamily ATP-dependent carboligase